MREDLPQGNRKQNPNQTQKLHENTRRSVPPSQPMPNRSSSTNKTPPRGNERNTQKAPDNRLSSPEQSPVQRKSTSSVTKASQRQTARKAPTFKPRKRRSAKVVIKSFFRKFISYSIIFIIFYTLIASLYAGYVIASVLHTTKASREDSYDITVEITPPDDDKQAEVATYEADTVYFNNIAYLPFDALKNYTEIIEIGDYKSRTLIISGNGESIRCFIDTNKALIGNDQLFLIDSVKFIDNKIYLPLDFYQNMINGIKIKLDKEKSRYYITRDETKDISFKIHPQIANEHCLYVEPVE